MNAFIYIFFLVIPFSNCTEIENVRNEFHKIDSKESLYSFLEKFEKVNCFESEPYIASAIMHKAHHSNSPFKKMRFFKEGKERLELFIKQNPNHIEARYLRALIQNEIPKFLNYNDNLEKDTLFVVNNISKSDIPADYQKTLLAEIRKLNL